MKYFNFNLTEKYTASLLDLFNDMYIRYVKSDNTEYFHNVPIKFRSRERAVELSSHDTQEIINGNTSIIPRLSLSLEGLEAAPERNTNKYIRSHEVKTDTGLSFTLNSVSYDWNYTVILLARSMSETTQIIEQIAPLFRPTYTLNLNEMELLQEPTTVPIDLEGIDLDVDDNHDDDNIRQITTTFNIKLRGNMYLPIKNQNIIEQVRIYLDNWFLDDSMNEYEKAVKIEQNGDTKTRNISPLKITDLRPDNNQNLSQFHPVVTDIIDVEFPNDNIELYVGETIDIMGKVTDEDNEGDELFYIWKCTDGIISSNSGSNNSHKIVYKAINEGTFTISLQVIDYHNNRSNEFTKNITVLP